MSFIALALEHGGNLKAIQMIVGHSSLEMTMNVYARACRDRTFTCWNNRPFTAHTDQDKGGGSSVFGVLWDSGGGDIL